MVLAPELASPNLRGAGSCSARALLMAVQGMAKAPSMSTGAAELDPETCQLKSCWCCDRDVSPAPSLNLPVVVHTRRDRQPPSPTVGSPGDRPVGATGPAQVSSGEPRLQHLFLGVEVGGEGPACAQ